jgi:hypothetical protein
VPLSVAFKGDGRLDSGSSRRVVLDECHGMTTATALRPSHQPQFPHNFGCFRSSGTLRSEMTYVFCNASTFRSLVLRP